MNKNKIAILILIVATTAILGYFIGKVVLGGNKLKPVDVESARAIMVDVKTPDPSVFNDKAINPTATITIGQNNQDLIGN
jgi:hypothetical protein